MFRPSDPWSGSRHRDRQIRKMPLVQDDDEPCCVCEAVLVIIFAVGFVILFLT